MNVLAEEWKSLYGAYMVAQREYLKLKLSSGIMRKEKLLSDGFLGRFAASKLERAHCAMQEFLEAHPTLMESPNATPELELRRRHPTEDLIIEPRGVQRESVLETA